tara:strand:- start:32 stop:550 length:519 start_codon:yes stop_codon:yes gene_type:complete
MTTQDLIAEEYNPFYSTYINMVPIELDLIDGFQAGFKNVQDFFKSIPKDKLEYKYADGKWTIKEVFQHIIDTERIFMYRCLRVARQDKTPLAGFEQNDYIVPSRANSKTIESLLEEYQITRKNSIVLLKSFSNEDLKCIGTASGNVMSARSAAFSTIGHEIWHINVIKERYL